MTTLVYALACLALCAGAVWLRVVPRAREEAGQLLAALSELRAAGLSDEERERRARQAGIRALIGTGGLFLRLAVIAVVTVAPVWLADVFALSSAGAVAALALQLDALIVTSVVLIVLAIVVRRRWRARV